MILPNHFIQSGYDSVLFKVASTSEYPKCLTSTLLFSGSAVAIGQYGRMASFDSVSACENPAEIRKYVEKMEGINTAMKNHPSISQLIG
jgi:hypothetical protein